MDKLAKWGKINPHWYHSPLVGKKLDLEFEVVLSIGILELETYTTSSIIVRSIMHKESFVSVILLNLYVITNQ